jgi:replicative DNA helicase
MTERKKYRSEALADANGRLVPYNVEAEEAVLASILVDSTRLDAVIGKLKPEHFYREKNQWIYEAMLAMRQAGAQIDQLTVSQQLGVCGQLEPIGGPAYLSHIIAILPTSVHCEHYADIVISEAFRRSLILCANKVSAIAFEGGQTLEMYAKSVDTLMKIEPADKAELITPKEHVDAMYAMLSQYQKGESNAVPFGYLDLDKSLGGMYPSDLIIIAARPSIGKSQVALEIALHVAHKQFPILFASAEMSLLQLMEREITMYTKIEILRLRRGELDDREWKLIGDLTFKVSTMPLYFIPVRMSIHNIAQQARLLAQTKGLRLVVVDYIQLLADTHDRSAGDNANERVAYISNNLKTLAKELDIPVVAISQLNRMVEARPNKRPMLSDLRDSGAIEQDADVVLMLYRDLPIYRVENGNPNILEINIAKSRQVGVTGEPIKVLWMPKEYRYRDYTERE